MPKGVTPVPGLEVAGEVVGCGWRCLANLKLVMLCVA